MAEKDDEEILFTRKFAAQAQDLLGDTIGHLPKDKEEMVRIWLDGYLDLEKLRSVNRNLPECREGWKRGKSACKECGTLQQHIFFRDYTSRHFDEIRVDLEVHYNGLSKKFLYSWGANGASGQTLVGPSASMTGYASSYDEACFLADQAAQDIANMLRRYMEVA